MSLILLNSGCATIFSGSTDTLHISVDQDGAELFINDQQVGKFDENKYIKAVIPKKGRIELLIRRKDCEDEIFNLQREIDPLTFLGLLIDGGIFSIVVVDILGTNAFVKASQTELQFELECPGLH